eukprot:2194995-Amphidinium_carterae.1
MEMHPPVVHTVEASPMQALQHQPFRSERIAHIFGTALTRLLPNPHFVPRIQKMRKKRGKRDQFCNFTLFVKFVFLPQGGLAKGELVPSRHLRPSSKHSQQPIRAHQPTPSFMQERSG